MNKRFCSAFTIISALALGSAPVEAGLIGHWTFDDADPIADLTVDSEGANNGGEGLNLAAAPAAKVGKGAIDFGKEGPKSEKSNFVIQQAGDFSIAAEHSGLTIAFWYKAPADLKTAEGVNRLPVHFRNDENSTSVAVEFSNGTARAFVRHADASRFVRATGTTDIFDDKWHHVMMVYMSASGTAAIYIDGKQDATESNAEVGNVLTLTHGRVGSHDTDLDINIGGHMDDLRIWNQAMTPQEVGQAHGVSGTPSAVGGAIAKGDAKIVPDRSGSGVLVPAPGKVASSAAGRPRASFVEAPRGG